MKITIFGSGYIGLVTAACMADMNNEVLCVDIDADKITALQAGFVPIFEAHLQDIVVRNMTAKRLQFSTDTTQAVLHGDALFIAVGTPPLPDGAADTGDVMDVARQIGLHLNSFKAVVIKSTVPVGTAARVKAEVLNALLARGLSNTQEALSVVSNPEFLKEGSAVADFMHPERIILGCDADSAGLRAKALMNALYEPFSTVPTFHMDVKSAELTKYATNAMLAARISLMNELANLADSLGADIEHVRLGIGADSRIGPDFLYAGIGYGGSCFPKDVQALVHAGKQAGRPMAVLSAVHAVNQLQKRVLMDKIVARMGADLRGKTFAFWGMAYKPDTDDMREAPSRVLVAELLARGAQLRVFDPAAMDNAAHALQAELDDGLMANITFCENAMGALIGADALVLATEWAEFQAADLCKVLSLLKSPTIFDGRNQFDPDTMRSAGFDYYAIGRPHDVAAQSK
jgi:UDPglucose 6-dehydrogenase